MSIGGIGARQFEPLGGPEETGATQAAGAAGAVGGAGATQAAGEVAARAVQPFGLPLDKKEAQQLAVAHRLQGRVGEFLEAKAHREGNDWVVALHRKQPSPPFAVDAEPQATYRIDSRTGDLTTESVSRSAGYTPVNTQKLAAETAIAHVTGRWPLGTDAAQSPYAALVKSKGDKYEVTLTTRGTHFHEVAKFEIDKKTGDVKRLDLQGQPGDFKTMAKIPSEDGGLKPPIMKFWKSPDEDGGKNPGQVGGGGGGAQTMAKIPSEDGGVQPQPGPGGEKPPIMKFWKSPDEDGGKNPGQVGEPPIMKFWKSPDEDGGKNPGSAPGDYPLPRGDVGIA
jgi:hypothetical protein